MTQDIMVLFRTEHSSKTHLAQHRGRQACVDFALMPVLSTLPTPVSSSEHVIPTLRVCHSFLFVLCAAQSHI